MSWREALIGRCSGLANGNVYWSERYQKDGLPALVLLMISDERPQHLKDYDLSPGRVQFDAYGKTPEAAWLVTDATIATLVPGGSYGGHLFSRGMVELAPRDLSERIGGDTIFRVSMDITFHHVPDPNAS